ncbi:Bacteriophage N4 adsorption protein A C-terminal domain-containing protein [Comamonas aquatilis]|uniref:NfrA family protein n=1 Tax=Comamonas aquatilis TaxID=1778406 RepID=UPI0039EE9E4D
MTERTRGPMPALMSAIFVALLGSAAGVQAQERALTGAAWQHADRAYKAYAKGDYVHALQEARAARRLRPDVPRLQALEEQARATVDAANAASAAQEKARRAQALAQQAYAKAQQPEQVDAAVALIRQALQLNPQPLPWHVLQARLLLSAQRWSEVDAGLQIHPNQSALLQAKAYALLQQGQDVQALQVLDQTLSSASGLSADARAGLLRQGADTALAAGQLAQGREWARQLQTMSAENAAQDAAVRLQLLQSGLSFQLSMPAPDLSCNAEAVCTASYAFDIENGLANAAYAAARLQQWPQVQSLSQTLLKLQPAKGACWQLLIAALQGQGQGDVARTQAQQALQAMAGQDSGLKPAELAQIAHTAGDKQAEADFYTAAEQGHALPAAQLEDAAFAAEHVGDSRAAVRRHVAALDSADTGQIRFTSQQRQDVRLAVGDLDRQWGSSAGVFSSRGSTLPGGQSGSSGYRSLQTVGEVFWRPQQLRGDGTFVDLYGRYMGNLRAAPQEATGPESSQLALGIRAKPFGSQNLIVAAERWQKLGAASRNDWLLRAAYSYTKDMYGPVNRERWMTGDLYLEAGRYLQSGEKYATGELRYGPQWRLRGSDSGNWGLWGYGVAAAEYNSSYRRTGAGSVGVGVSLRRWLREDRTHAGRSWVDFTVQYRVRMGGDDRASGLVARASWYY